jgi:hypothetical protein
MPAAADPPLFTNFDHAAKGLGRWLGPQQCQLSSNRRRPRWASGPRPEVAAETGGC